MRRKERDGCVTPIIDNSRWAILGIKLEDGQQFHCGDPEFLKIPDLLDQSPVSAASLLHDAGTGVKCEPRYMHLIDNGQRRWLAWRFIAFPVVFQGIDHDALHRGCSIAPWLMRSLSVVAFGDSHAA